MGEFYTAIVAAAFGALAGVIFAGLFESKRSRRQNVLDFYNRFILDQNNRLVWEAVWHIRECWFDADDKSILLYFLRGDDIERRAEKPSRNSMTPHQNLSIALHFWTSVNAYRRRGLLDNVLSQDLLGHLYEWNADFYKDFVNRYELEPSVRRHEVDPAWVNSIKELDLFFRPQKTDAS